MGAFRLLEHSDDEHGNDSGSALANQIASLISALSDHGIWIVVLVGLGVLTKRFSLRSALIALAVVGFSSLGLNTVIKRFVNKERPDADSPAAAFVRRPTSSSFPSGHTLATAAAAVAFPATTAGVTAGLIATSGVAWSRVQLKAHDPVDVAAGAGIGVILGWCLRRSVQAVLRNL